MAGTDLGAENERRPLDWLTAVSTHLIIQLGTLWAVGFRSLSQLALSDGHALLGRLRSQQRPVEVGNEEKKNYQSDSHSTEKGYFKEYAGMFHSMSQEGPVCRVLMKLGFKYSFAVLVFIPISMSLQ